MTLVVTHTQGFLGCFTTEADGTMRQRALIDTGKDDPTPLELAELGEAFAATYKWETMVGGAAGSKAIPTRAKAIPPNKPTKAIPQAKPRQYRQGATIPGDMGTEERLAFIISYLRGHPEGCTLRQLLESRGLDYNDASGRWHHNMKHLEAEGLIYGAKMNGFTNSPMIWKVKEDENRNNNHNV